MPDGAHFDLLGGTAIETHLGDCLDVLPRLPAASADLILADPPYGTTRCSWDSVIDPDRLWPEILRVARPRAAIILFGTAPFSSKLVMEQPRRFAHAWVWNKGVPGNFMQAKRQPLKYHEDVLVFSPDGKQPAYYPVMEEREKPQKMGGLRVAGEAHGNRSSAEAKARIARKVYTHRYPGTILDFPSRADPERGLHPTQKPRALMEYLVRTYSRPGDAVLDFTMGSGTTGVAATALGRSFIGIERDPAHYYVAVQRMVLP